MGSLRARATPSRPAQPASRVRRPGPTRRSRAALGGGTLAAAALLGTVTVAATVGTAAPAGAALDGGCTAVATFLLGVGTGSITVDARVASTDEPVTIGAEDAVEWRVSVPGRAAAEPMRGRIEIDLPWPLGTQTIEEWSGTATQGEATGLYTYQLTKAFPRGVPFSVVGSHGQPDVACVGQVALQIEGGPFDSWWIWVGLGGMALSAIALLLAGRARWVQLA